MVRGFFLIAATSLVSGLVGAQEAPLACAVGCVEGIYRDPSRLGCSMGDKNCACHSGQNFEFGVRDCITQACNWSGDVLQAQLAAAKKYGDDGCLSFTSTAASAPAATAAPPPPPPAETPAPAATSAAQNPAAPAQTPANDASEAPKPPASSEAPKPSPSPDAPKPSSEAPEASPTPKTSAAAPKPEATTANPTQPTTTPAAAATDAGPSSSASSTGAAVTAATASDAPESSSTVNSQTAKTGESEDDDDGSSSGLTVAAKAGIGAGAGVAVAMMAITACCILMRRRAQNQPKANAGPARPARSPMPNISRPIGGGRQYAEDIESAPAGVTGFPAMAHVPSQNSSVSSPKPTFGHSDERYSVKGNRYEDMLPRTQPRTMI